MSKLRSTWPWNSLKKLFGWKILVFPSFYRFLTFSDNIPAFCRLFFVIAVRTAFWLSKGTFIEQIVFWQNYFFPLVQWAKKFFEICLKNFYCVPHFGFLGVHRLTLAKNVICFEKNRFFPTLPYLGKNFSNFSWKDFGSVVKNAFCVSMETICGRIFFLGEIMFFITSGPWAMCLPLFNFF